MIYSCLHCGRAFNSQKGLNAHQGARGSCDLGVGRLTSSEQATYQALRARGVSHDDALSDALDGVDVETVRRWNQQPRLSNANIQKAFAGLEEGPTDEEIVEAMVSIQMAVRNQCQHNPGTLCADIMRAGNGHCCQEYVS